jgi:hypothetical protein
MPCAIIRTRKQGVLSGLLKLLLELLLALLLMELLEHQHLEV